MGNRPTVMVTMGYDKVGNRTSVNTGYLNMPSQAGNTKYFQYDAMNRQTVVDSDRYVSRFDALDAAQGFQYATRGIVDHLGSKGHYLTYDKAGNRSSDTYQGRYGNLVGYGNWQGYQGLKVDAFSYDAHGRLVSVKTRGYDANRAGTDSLDSMEIDQRQYDGAGRVVRSGSNGVPLAYFRAVDGPQNNWDHPVVGDGTEQRFNSYDANGRIQRQTVLWSDGNLKHHIDYKQYDGAGNLLKYTMFGYQLERDYTSYATEYSYSYQRMQGYLEASVSARGLSQTEAASSDATGNSVTRGKPIVNWRGQGNSASSTSSYDRQGHLYRVRESASDGTSKTRNIVNNAEGVALTVSDSAGTAQTQLVASGQVLGRYSQSHAEFNFGYETVGRNYPASTPANWVVAEGDTLQRIARSVYGNAGQWYLIAEANGLDANSTLRLGQVLSIPKGVGGASNNAETYKPYDARSVVGDTTPALPMPQGNGANGCGGLGQIIMIVVAVVVSIYTMGVFSQALVGILSGIGQAAAAGALAGAAGSLASQAVGNAIGAQDGINWKGVALGALSGAIAGGLAANGSALAGKGWEMTTVRAASASALTQGVAVVTGLQKSFDWRSVAASAVGAGLGAALGDANDGQGAFSDLGALGGLVRGTMAGIASGTAAAVMRGGRVSIQQVASDAFGNALGGVFVDIAQRASAQEDILMQASQESLPASEIEEQNAGVDAQETSFKGGEEWVKEIERRKLINDPLGLIASINDFSGVIDKALALQGQMLAPANDHSLSDESTNAQFLAREMARVYGDGELWPMGGSVRVTPGNGMRPATVNGVSVNHRADAAFQAAGDLFGVGEMYRDFRLLAVMLNNAQQADILNKIQGALQEKLGKVHPLPTPSALGAVQEIWGDGVVRYNDADLIERYGDALRKVAMWKKGIIELDTRTMLITSIGNQRMSPSKWVEENKKIYLMAYNRNLDEAKTRYANGERLFRADMPEQLQTSIFAHQRAEQAVKYYNTNMGVPEGPGQLLVMNRWAYDPGGSGMTVRPDMLLDLGPNRDHGGTVLRFVVDGKSSTAAAARGWSGQLRITSDWLGGASILVATPQGLSPRTPQGFSPSIPRTKGR